MSWLSRWFVLPKAHNSLSDVLGADAAKVISDTVHGLIVHAVASAVTSTVVSGEHALEAITATVRGAIHGTLQSISPALSDKIDQAIINGLKNAETVIESDIPTVTAAIVKEVGAVLKIS